VTQLLRLKNIDLKNILVIIFQNTA